MGGRPKLRSRLQTYLLPVPSDEHTGIGKWWLRLCAYSDWRPRADLGRRLAQVSARAGPRRPTSLVEILVLAI